MSGGYFYPSAFSFVSIQAHGNSVPVQQPGPLHEARLLPLGSLPHPGLAAEGGAPALASSAVIRSVSDAPRVAASVAFKLFESGNWPAKLAAVWLLGAVETPVGVIRTPAAAVSEGGDSKELVQACCAAGWWHGVADSFSLARAASWPAAAALPAHQREVRVDLAATYRAFAAHYSAASARPVRIFADFSRSGLQLLVSAFVSAGYVCSTKPRYAEGRPLVATFTYDPAAAAARRQGAVAGVAARRQRSVAEAVAPLRPLVEAALPAAGVAVQTLPTVTVAAVAAAVVAAVASAGSQGRQQGQQGHHPLARRPLVPVGALPQLLPPRGAMFVQSAQHAQQLAQQQPLQPLQSMQPSPQSSPQLPSAQSAQPFLQVSMPAVAAPVTSAAAVEPSAAMAVDRVALASPPPACVAVPAAGTARVEAADGRPEVCGGGSLLRPRRGPPVAPPVAPPICPLGGARSGRAAERVGAEGGRARSSSTSSTSSAGSLASDSSRRSRGSRGGCRRAGARFAPIALGGFFSGSGGGGFGEAAAAAPEAVCVGAMSDNGDRRGAPRPAVAMPAAKVARPPVLQPRGAVVVTPRPYRGGGGFGFAASVAGLAGLASDMSHGGVAGAAGRGGVCASPPVGKAVDSPWPTAPLEVHAAHAAPLDAPCGAYSSHGAYGAAAYGGAAYGDATPFPQLAASMWDDDVRPQSRLGSGLCAL